MSSNMKEKEEPARVPAFVDSIKSHVKALSEFSARETMKAVARKKIHAIYVVK